MKTKIITILLGIFFLIHFSSCVPKSDYEELLKENEELRIENFQLRDKLLSIQVRDKYIQQNCNEDKALQELKSYLSFYCSKCLFNDFNVRKFDDCSFDINMKKKINDNIPGRYWVSVVVRITFTEDGKFTIKDIENSHTWGCN